MIKFLKRRYSFETGGYLTTFHDTMSDLSMKLSSDQQFPQQNSILSMGSTSKNYN